MNVTKRAKARAKSRLPRDTPAMPLESLWHWQRRNRHLFASEPSLRWHLREHRRAYAEAGALVTIAGRFFIDTWKFEQVLCEIGARAAAKGALDAGEARV